MGWVMYVKRGGGRGRRRQEETLYMTGGRTITSYVDGGSYKLRRPLAEGKK